MTRLTWGERPYEVGVDRGVCYTPGGIGESWNGLTNVEESPSESSETRYQDGIKLPNRKTSESFSATIEAFTYPPSFEERLGLSGGLISRRRQGFFDFSYRIMTESGYKIHLVYNALATPTSYSYQQNDASPFSWDVTTRPRYMPSALPSAHIVVDSSLAYETVITQLEDILYGNDAFEPRMPTPEEVYAIFEENSILRVIDLGAGVFRITGPDDAVITLDANTSRVTWPSVIQLDTDTYSISSL